MPSCVSSKPINLLVSTQAFVAFGDEATNGAFNNGTLVENRTQDGKTRYRILGLSEGIHNGLRVLREDIQQMAHDVSVSTETIPVVLDHSFNWNDVVGKITGVMYHDTYVAPDGKRLNGALLMDIELLPPSDNTPKLNESLYRLEQLPELAKFSVAFKFTPITDENGNVTVHDLVLKHLAIVTNPADSSTQILEKLSKKENTEYMSFDLDDMESINYRGNNMPLTRPSMHAARFGARRYARFNNPAVDAIARNPLTAGTYPIKDVSSITMKVGQRSPLACGCGDELYERQNGAQFAQRRARARFAAQRRARYGAASRALFSSARRARFAAQRRAARFGARRNARFGAQRTARFTQYGVPTVFGNPWEYPVSDVYPNVNQLIALRNKQQALKARSARFGRRANLLEERENTKFGARRAARFAAQRRARFGARRARFDDEIMPVEPVNAFETVDEVENPSAVPEHAPVQAPVEPGVPAEDAFAPVQQVPAFDVAQDNVAEGIVSNYTSDDVIPTDPVVQAYVDAGLVSQEEIPVVEVALKQHRATKFAAQRRAARFAAQRSTRFEAQRPVARRARFAQRPTTRRSSRFEGLINEYMVPSANLPRKLNVNIREPQNAAFAQRRAARFGARAPARRSGSFFADGGIAQGKTTTADAKAVPAPVTSLAPNYSASSSPATFVGRNKDKTVVQELEECKQKLAQAEDLSLLRAQALSMQLSDKDLIMTFSEDQLKKYIASKGNQQGAFTAQGNPFGAKTDQEKISYIAEFADSFTKGNYNTVCTIDQISSNAEAKAKQLFGGN